MRQQAAKSLRRLADHVQGTHPDMITHQHLRDAARVLESGNEEGAQRHLRAAIGSMTPQTLLRHGILDDTGHIQAKQAMSGVHRHLLLVKDIQDVAAKNQAAIRRDSYGDYESGPSLPHSPVHADPNAGYGPGALAQKPTQRQPGGNRALNAPDRTNSGGSDPNVADPVGVQPKGSKQFAASWDEVAAVIELAFIADPTQAQWAVIDARTGHSDDRSAIRSYSAAHAPTGSQGHTDQLHAIADEADQKFPSTRPGDDIRAAAGSFSTGDAEGANQHLEDARMKLRGAAETKGQQSGRFGSAPAVRDSIALDNVLKMNKGQAQMMAQDQEDAARAAAKAAAKAAKQAAKAQNHAADWDDLAGVIELISTQQNTAKAQAQPRDPPSGQFSTSQAAKQAAATSTAASKTSSSSSGSSSSSKASSAPSVKTQITSLQKQITGWQGQVKQLLGAAAQASGQAAKLANDGQAVELSAETGRLAVTPAPYGKPGGPGLYDVKGLKHSDYLENIVHALMRKGMDKGKATAIARGSIRRWMVKSKHPEVRAAAGLAETQEIAAQARAHAHANTWDELAAVIELGGPGSGQVGHTTAQPAGPGRPVGQGQPAPAAAKPAAAKPAAGQGKPAGGSGGPQALLQLAAQKRQQAGQIQQQITSTQKIIAAAQAGVGQTASTNNATSAQSGSTTSSQSGSTTASSAPATSSTASTPSSSSSGSSSSSPSSSSSGSGSGSGAAADPATTAAITQMQGQVKVWQGQVATLMAQATALTTTANKMQQSEQGQQQAGV